MESSYELRKLSHGSGPNSGCLRGTAYFEVDSQMRCMPKVVACSLGPEAVIG